MAGGTFQSQNKVRAGAYINFESVPKPMTKVGTRGVGTLPVPLSWGPQLIELYSTDLTDGSALAKIGLDVTEDEALIIAKMNTKFPENGGYVIWVSTALGTYWGLQQGWMKWLNRVIDNASTPFLFLDYLNSV